jgi:hypothetical protein
MGNTIKVDGGEIAKIYPSSQIRIKLDLKPRYQECADCGSTGHDTGSDTCPGPDAQDRLEDPNRQVVR